MGKARPSSHALSYIPNIMFLFLSLIIQLLKTIKPTHKILSLTHRKCEVNPIYEYFLLFCRKINMAVLNCIGIKSSHIPFTFITGNWIGVKQQIQSDWCDIDTSLTDPLTVPLTDPLTEPPITYPTRRLRGIFLQKNNSTNAHKCRPLCNDLVEF